MSRQYQSYHDSLDEIPDSDLSYPDENSEPDPLETPLPGAKAILDLRNVSRAEWLINRKIGGSDAAAAVGESPYGNEFSLWAEKTGRVPPRTGSEAMEMGSLLEDLIASVFARRTGFDVQKCHWMFVHPEYDWMTATPDFFISREGTVTALVQIKNTSEYKADDWSDGPPHHVYLQIQHEMIVTGVREAYAVALIGGNRLVYHHLTLDEDAVDDYVERLARFWVHVETGTPPPITAEDKDALAGMYPESRERVITLPSDAEGFVYRYRKAQAAIADAERERDLASNCLKAMLGDAAEGYAGDVKVTWKTQTRKSYVVPAKTFRAFSIRTAKGAK
jgi:putative phage-type endonuclease